MTLNPTSSNIINYLKCLLCVGVVFIHARFFPDLSIVGLNNNDNYYVYNAIDSYFILGFLNQTCVPLFYIISGYLFFLNIPEVFDLACFKNKWKGRVRSLLIPYMFCNGLYLLTTILMSTLNGDNINIFSITSAFWNYTGGYPIMMPSWYLRDLMVVCLFTPLIWLVVKYTKYLLPLILSICWFFDLWVEEPGFGIRSFLFFTIGSYIGMKKGDIIEIIHPRNYWPIWCLVFIFFYGSYIYNDVEAFHKMAILASFPVWICFAYLISNVVKKQCSRALVSGTFFVFLYHFPIAHRVPVVITRFIGVSGTSIVFSYIVGALLTTTFLLSLFFVGRRIMPKSFLLVVGGR